MKIEDRQPLTQFLTRYQHYFCANWLNMVHANSLDSYRVRLMNPGNILRELLRIYEPPANESDRVMVASEVIRVLNQDPLMGALEFSSTYGELKELLPICSGKLKDKCTEKNRHLIIAFAKELLYLIDNKYISLSFKRLNYLLASNTDVPFPGKEEEIFREIHALTGNLLSMLLDKGGSLESMYSLYREDLVPKGNSVKPYFFERKFALVEKIISNQPQDFVVIFVIDNVSVPQDFPPKIANIEFAQEIAIPEDSRTPVKRLLAPFKRRLFARLSVKTNDFRTAGTNPDFSQRRANLV
jgi:hypothetical protein